MTLLPVFTKTVFRICTDYLYFPRKIAMFLKDFEGRDFSLRNPRGYTWDVKVEFVGFENTEARFVGDWKQFMLDNDIQDDFSIVFMNNEPYILDVNILDAKGVSNTIYWGENEKQKREEPYFDVNISKTALTRGIIGIPKAFWNEHIVKTNRSNETRATILGSGNRRWVVDIIEHADGRHFLSNGDKDMLRELELPIHAYGQLKLQNVPGIVLAFWI